MKKLLVYILALAMVMSMVLIPVAAEETNVVAKATPTVDGVLDDIWAQTYSTTVDVSAPIWIPKEHTDNDLKATTYFLHDGQWLYIAAVVTGDTSVVDTGMEDWVADSVEVWFSNSEDAYTKVPMGAYGNALPNGAIGAYDNKLGIDFTGHEIAATQSANGYVVELKMPIPYYDASNSSIGINVQLNNVSDANTDGNNVGEMVAGFFGSQATGADPIVLTLSAKELAPAVPNDVLTGAPTVDGKLDDMYKQSYKATVDTSAPIWVPVASEDKVSADVYFLHKDGYLYVAAVVTGDSAVVDTGLTSWVGDSVEIWFRSEELHDGKVKYTKVPMGAYGNALPNGAVGPFDNLMDLDLSNATVAATQNGNGYVVEMKLAIPYYNAAQDSIAINIQLNNVYDADANGDNIASKNGGFYGSQATGADPIVLTLSSKTVTVSDSSNAKTGDTISVFVALLAVSAVGTAVILKKKEF